MIKSLFFKYQRAMFYSGQARNEIAKVIGPANEYAVYILVLAQWGFKLNIIEAGFVFMSIMIGFVMLGLFLGKVGVIDYNIGLSNNHNPEIVSILKKLEDIEKRLK